MKKLFLLAAMFFPISAVSACDGAAIMNDMFNQLEQIGESGEAKLGMQLDRLKQEKQWNDEQSNALLLEIADSAETNQAEDLRNTAITEMFKMQNSPGLDCKEMSGIRDEVLKLEQQQWDNLVAEITRRLSL